MKYYLKNQTTISLEWRVFSFMMTKSYMILFCLVRTHFSLFCAFDNVLLSNLPCPKYLFLSLWPSCGKEWKLKATRLEIKQLLVCFVFSSPTQVDLDVTLPGEGGKDRPFKVSIKFVSRVSWHLLHEVLTGRTLPEPLELDKPISTNPVHAVDVVLRHLPSMK